MGARATRAGNAHARKVKWREGEWRLQAACIGATQTEQRQMTSPLSARGMTWETARKLIRQYCNDCPVKRECSEWALSEFYFIGIAGGEHLGWAQGQTATRAGRRIRQP